MASNLNMVPNHDVPNLVTVRVGAGGQVSFYNNAGSTDVVADVVGYFDDGTQPQESLYTPTPPARVLDTRSSLGHAGQLGQNQTMTVQVAGQGGVPSNGATAVVLNVTATDESLPSFLTVYPADVGQPGVSNLNLYPSTNIANLVVVRLPASGMISFYNNAGSTDVVADVAGYYTTSGGSHFIATPPSRVLDTRTGTGDGPGPLGQGQAMTLTVAGHGGVPATGATAVVMNMTAADGTVASFLTAYPASTPRPLASNLNFYPGGFVPNLAITDLGTGASVGKIDIYNDSGSVDVVGDVSGYYE